MGRGVAAVTCVSSPRLPLAPAELVYEGPLMTETLTVR